MTTRGRALRLGLPVAAGLVVLLAVLLVGALVVSPTLVAVAGLGLMVCELTLQRLLASAFPRQREILSGALHARITLEQALLLVYVMGEQKLTSEARTTVVIAVVLFQALWAVHSAMALVGTRLATPRARLRNAAGPRNDRPWLAPITGPIPLRLLVAATALPALGLLGGVAGDSYTLLVPAAITMVMVAASVVAVSAPTLLSLLRRPRGRALVRQVHEAVLRHRPEVVLYSDGGVKDLHWVTPWLDTLDELGKLGRPALVMLRRPEVIDLLPDASTPIVCLPRAGDILPFTLPDARVALYPANTGENFRLLRSPDLRSAFIGHGDSDKASSASPLSKAYDEVWVAGEAGRRRYLKAAVGVRPEQIRIVGRPQTRGIQRLAPRDRSAPCTVLYAPTWEGLYGDETESSLLRSGAEVVGRLLTIKGIRVLYRPHPNTGARDARFARAHEKVVTLLAEAGRPHATAEAATTDLHAAFNMADVLVTDITSLISDFLASGKPYVVVNSTDLSESAFRERFPSSAGAAVVDNDADGLEAAIIDALGPDTMREERERLREELIGPPTDDPVRGFAEAIDALGATLRPRSRSRGHGVAATRGAEG